MPNLFGPGADWRCMPATPNQLATIRRNRLAAEDDLPTMNRGYASQIINDFVTKTKKTGPDIGSPAQIRLVTNLATDLGEDPEPYLAKLTYKTAGGIINGLRHRLTTENKLAEGLYMVGDQIYRVGISDKGYRYANRLVKLAEPEPASNGLRTHRFVHIPGAITQIKPEHALTREQAMAFGQETSSCVRCGTQLSTTIRQRDGSPRWIGPNCEKTMNWA